MQTSTLEPAAATAKKLDLNAPVYPTPVGAKNSGISTFDWLAAMAMQAFVMHGIKVKADRAMTEEEKDADLADRSYRMAIAMLRAREDALKMLG